MARRWLDETQIGGSNTNNAPSGGTGNQSVPQNDSGGYKKYTQGFGSILDTLGLRGVTDILGGAYEGQRAVQSAMGNKNAYYDPKKGTVANPFLSDERLAGLDADTLKGKLEKGTLESAKSTAGLASYGIPMGKGTLIEKILASSGSGVANEFSQDNATPESMRNAALFSGAVPVVTSVVSKAFSPVKNQAKKLVLNAFNPKSAEISNLKKVGIDFVDEFVNKDMKNVQSLKDPEQIAQYFMDKSSAATSQADDFLRRTGKTADSGEVAKLIADAYGERSDRVLQKQARNTLNELFGDFTRINYGVDLTDKNQARAFVEAVKSGKSLPLNNEGIPLDILNQMKRDISQAGKGFYTASGYPAPESDALASIARKIGTIIENNAEGYKALNRDTMYYKVAEESIQNAINVYQKKPGLLQKMMGPAFGVPMAAGLMFGHPLLGALTGASAVGAEALSNPKNKLNIARKAIAPGSDVPPWLKDVVSKATTIGAGRTGAMFGK